MRAAQSSMASSKQAAVCQGTDDARDIDKILDLIGSTSPSKLLTGDRAPAASYNGSPAANSRSAVSAGTPTQKHTDAVSATSHTPDGQSVDDFLNDLDSALMPSPKAAQPPSGSSQPPAAALGPSLAPPPLLPSRSAGASMQQRMFPSMGSPPTKLGSDSEHASTGSRSSSFESVTSGHLPLHIGSGLAGRHSAPVVGGSASSSAAPRAGVPMEVIASAASSGKQAKCSRVMLAGSAIARGVKSSAFSKWYA